MDEDKKYSALSLSNLTAIHQKTPIGRLSAYCGAVSAGAGAGAGIAYLCGGGFKEVVHTVVNALAIVSGIVCDGAKASCAAKIASAVDAGILGYNMYIRGQQFYGGDGIVTKGCLLYTSCLLLSFDLEPDHGCLCDLLLLFQQSQTLEA